jgi:outer membrane scaffolding protein for murein synthesis (MipA/OmpV family)
MLKSAAIAVLLLKGSVLAAQNNALEPNPQATGTFSSGIGIVASYNAIEGASNRVMAVPFFFYESEHFYFRGAQAGYRLYREGPLSFSADLRAEFQSWKPSDSPVLQGMADRKITAEAGINARYRIDNWEMRAGIWQDVLGRHKGWQGELALAYNHRVNRQWIVSPRIELQALSSKKANYYFGVRPEEALPQRPQYNVGSTYSLALATSVRYLIDSRWTVYADVGAAYLSSDIRNSPIVDRRWLPRIITGLSYRW